MYGRHGGRGSLPGAEPADQPTQDGIARIRSTTPKGIFRRWSWDMAVSYVRYKGVVILTPSAP